MVEYIVALALLGIALLTIDLRKTYNFFPVRELKRQARAGDHEAATVYRAVAYGGSLRLLLWIIIGITVAASLVLLTQIAPVWLSTISVVLVIWYAFAWAPNGRVTNASAKLAVIVTPLLAWILYYLHRPLDAASRFISRNRHVTFHTGLFEKADLIELVSEQRDMVGSRISKDELNIVLSALSFSDKSAASIMIPGRDVKTVNQSDTLGPILMDELYEGKHSRFPVIGDDGHSIVGTLYLRDLVAARHGGLIGDIMQPQVYYVHETQTLYQVLHAFLTTKHQIFIVINSKEQAVGIVTIEDVLEQVIGHKIADEFDSYDDRHAVASYPHSSAVSGESRSVEMSPDMSDVAPTELVDDDNSEIIIPHD